MPQQNDTLKHKYSSINKADRDVERMIRVDHAGEYGAKRIYEGQLAVLKDSDVLPVIQHMQEQEQEHLNYFAKAVPENRVRPTALLPFWHVAGYALGAGTALLGKEAAMACTVAVEEVIDEHYAEQERELETRGKAEEKPLLEAIRKFRAEELEHRDTGLEHHAEQAVAYPLLTSAIRLGSKLAIAVAKRI